MSKSIVQKFNVHLKFNLRCLIQREEQEILQRYKKKKLKGSVKIKAGIEFDF